jgi:hypothetical protein
VKNSFVILIAAALGACAQASSKSNGGMSTAATADTVIGVVSEVGADPMTWMAVQPASGGASMRLSGAGAATLRAVTGAQVWLSGARQTDGFRVDTFEVRMANGKPVDDGVVGVDGNRISLRMRSGAQRDIPDAPAELRNLAGARIWVSRPVSNQVPSYGLIQRP